MLQPQFDTEFTPSASSAHRVSDDLDIFTQIGEPGVNLCLWTRPPESEIERELGRLTADSLPDVRSPTSFASFDGDVSALLEKQELDPAEFECWRADLRRLSQRYFLANGFRNATLRLVTTDSVDCPRFHVDRTHLRLLCTYRGPGTEWLPNDQVDREAQGSGAANESIVRFGEPSRFEPYWAGLLKGTIYPGNEGNGLVHRSPMASDAEQTRVLFCLDY